MNIVLGNQCSKCVHVWTLAYEKSKDLTNLKLEYNETHEYPDLPLLEQRAKAGCTFCPLMRYAFREDAVKWFEMGADDIPKCEISILHFELFSDWEPKTPRMDAKFTKGQCIAFLQFPIGFMGSTNQVGRMEMCDFAVLFNHDLDHFHPLEPLDSGNIWRINRYIDTCLHNHGMCIQAQSGKDFVPSRLIDVTGDPDVVQLVRAPNGSKYATLSYCWGAPRKGFEDYKTVKANVEERYAGFRLDRQPPAIRDAVAVARALGIAYIWIDALCIIQGDRDDWITEGSQMDSVYENAYVTIAAAATKSVWESFLDRKAAWARVMFEGSNDDGNEAFDKLTLRHPFVQDDLNFMRDLEWSLRAWTMQEQALSIRTLHFTEQFFYLECLCGQEIEIESHGRPKRNPRPWHRPNRPTDIMTTAASTMYNQWYSIVQQYSTRKLSFETDRLLAILGLANRVAAELPADLYTSGLFKNDIARGLMWAPDTGYTYSRRNSEVPTWSWASLPGAVIYDCIGAGEDDEDCPIPVLTAPSDQNQSRLLLNGKILAVERLFASNTLVPVSEEVSSGSHTNKWTFWSDLINDPVEVSNAFALAVNRTQYEILGLLLERRAEKNQQNLAEYARKGYFELTHDEGPSLFESITEGQLVLV